MKNFIITFLFALAAHAAWAQEIGTRRVYDAGQFKDAFFSENVSILSVENDIVGISSLPELSHDLTIKLNGHTVRVEDKNIYINSSCTLTIDGAGEDCFGNFIVYNTQNSNSFYNNGVLYLSNVNIITFTANCVDGGTLNIGHNVTFNGWSSCPFSVTNVTDPDGHNYESYKASVDYGNKDHYCEDFSAAAYVASNAGSDASISLYANFTNVTKPVNIGSTSGVTLDLCGYGVEVSFNANPFIKVDEGKKLTIKDDDDAGYIYNVNGYTIANEGTLVVESGNIKNKGDDVGIKNDGTLTVNGGTVSSDNYKAIINEGTMTLNGGSVAGGSGSGDCGINNWGTATFCGGSVSGYEAIEFTQGTMNFNAMPTINGARNDLVISNDKVITFGDDIHISDGFKPVKVYLCDDDPYTFTSGFSTHVFDSDGNAIAPARVFAYNGNFNNLVPVLDTGGEVTFAAKSETVSFAAAGYATFFDSRFDVILPEGITAWIVKDKGESSSDGLTLVYERIATGGTTAAVVPAGTAVLLQTTPAAGGSSLTYTEPKATASYAGNLLFGSDTEVNASALTSLVSSSDKYFYKLSYGKEDTADKDVFGWYWGAEVGTSFTSGAHKAFLFLDYDETNSDPANARFLALPGIGEADGIAPATVGSAFAADNAAAGWFSLDGRRLAAQPAQPGVYVHGVRKVVVR